MSRQLPWIAGLVLVFVMAGTAFAGADIKTNAQVRYRANFDDKDFNGDTDPQKFAELRTRVGITATPQDNLKLFVQFQDSRRVGMNSGGLGNDANVGLHQGFLAYGLGKGWTVQAGRFEVAFGSQRLVGSVGWHNVGRTVDGVDVVKAGDTWRLDIFTAKLNENAFAAVHPDKDRKIGGLNFRCNEKKVDLFAYGDVNNTPGDGFDERDDTMITLGTHSARKFGGKFDYVTTLAYQLGTMSTVDTSDVKAETDIGAYLVAVEGGFTFPGKAKARAAVRLDLASGDDDMTDDKYKGFNNLYYTGHKFRGFMDYFLASSPLGLMDLALRLKMAPFAKWVFKADYHMFSAAQEFSDGTASGTTKKIGNEIDLTAAYKDGKFGCVIGVSTFTADDAAGNYAGNLMGDDGSTWGYIMGIANY